MNNIQHEVPDQFYLEVEGEDMRPLIEPFEQVLVDSTKHVPTDLKTVIVIRVWERLHVCKCAKFGNQVIMKHENGNISAVSQSDVEYIGVVTKVRGSREDNKKSLSAGNTKTFG